jgi:hypothetical protein
LFDSEYRDCSKNDNCWGDDRNNANKWAWYRQKLMAPSEVNEDIFGLPLYPNGCSQVRRNELSTSRDILGQFQLNWQNSPDSPAKCQQDFGGTRCICKRPA